MSRELFGLSCKSEAEYYQQQRYQGRSHENLIYVYKICLDDGVSNTCRQVIQRIASSALPRQMTLFRNQSAHIKIVCRKSSSFSTVFLFQVNTLLLRLDSQSIMLIGTSARPDHWCSSHHPSQLYFKFLTVLCIKQRERLWMPLSARTQPHSILPVSISQQSGLSQHHYVLLHHPIMFSHGFIFLVQVQRHFLYILVQWRHHLSDVGEA